MEDGEDVSETPYANIFTAAPSLNLTPEEKRVFGQLFREADKENIGVVTGEVAVKFFEPTRLEPRILGEVRHLPPCAAGINRLWTGETHKREHAD